MRAAALSMGALLALASAGAQAQLFETERMLTTPVEPGVVAPHRPTAAHAGDVGETGSLQVAAEPGSTLQDWYTRQGRPAVALFFDRRLERLPAGWDAAALAPRLSAPDGQSLRHYFAVASGGRCEVVAVVAPPAHLAGIAADDSDVGWNGFSRTRRLAAEALRSVAASGFDFRLADLEGPDGLPGSGDDDGWVDGVLLLHAEAGQENDPAHGLVQALQYTLDEPVTAGGVRAGPYAVASLRSGPGIWAHETAHLLGLEDRYDPLLPPRAGAAGDLVTGHVTVAADADAAVTLTLASPAAP